jgi:hypothetical protein
VSVVTAVCSWGHHTLLLDITAAARLVCLQAVVVISSWRHHLLLLFLHPLIPGYSSLAPFDPACILSKLQCLHIFSACVAGKASKHSVIWSSSERACDLLNPVVGLLACMRM